MSKRKTYEEVKEYVESQGYTLLSTEYVNNAEKLKISSPEGYVFMVSYNHFKRGVREPQTAVFRQSSKARSTIEDANKILSSKGLTLCSKFTGYRDKIRVTDGYTQWDTTLDKVKQGYTNKQYSESVYESIIGDILDGNDINYEQEHRIETNNRFLYLDFFIKEFNIAIEYDGVQHTKGNWNDDEYSTRDSLKNIYCKQQGIILIRVPYTKKSVTDIITVLNKYIPGIKRPKIFKRVPNKYLEINRYYRNHTSKETQKKFNVSDSTVRKSKTIFN